MADRWSRSINSSNAENYERAATMTSQVDRLQANQLAGILRELAAKSNYVADADVTNRELELSAEVDHLKHENRHLVEQIQQLQNQVSELQQEYVKKTEVARECEILLEKVNEQHAVRVKAYEEELLQLRSDTSTASNALNIPSVCTRMPVLPEVLKGRIEQRMRASEELQRDMAAKLEQLRQQSEELKLQLVSCKSIVYDIAKMRALLVISCKRKTLAAQSIHQELWEAKSVNAALNSKVRNLEERIQHMETTLNSTKNENGELTQKCAEQQGQLIRATELIALQESSLQQLRSLLKAA